MYRQSMWQSRFLLLWSGKAKAAVKLFTENKKENNNNKKKKLIACTRLGHNE